MAIFPENRKTDQFREGHGFLLLPHALNIVQLFSEEVTFFPEEHFSNSYLLRKNCHTSSGNRLRDKSLHNSIPFNWLESC